VEKLLETFEFHFYFRNYLRGETFVQFGPKKTQLSNEIWAPSGRNSGPGQAAGEGSGWRLATANAPREGGARRRRRRRRGGHYQRTTSTYTRVNLTFWGFCVFLGVDL
jgi:hypothetical protein